MTENRNIVRLLLPALFVLGACAEEPELPRADYAPDGSLPRQPDELASPNVVLISIDTLRADYLGVYGQALPTSPVLDSLARESVVFERAIACSPWTAPSHVSMMTSLYPTVHGVLDYPFPDRLDAKVVTLAEILRAHGWRTGGFTEGGHARGGTGLGDGFEVFPDWARTDEPAALRLVPNMERALAWLDAGDEPFFLFFHTYEPHHEYRPPRASLALVAPDFDVAAERRRLVRALERWNEGAELTPVQLGVLYRHSLQGDLRDLPVRRHESLKRRFKEFSHGPWRGSPGYDDDLAYIRMLYAAEVRHADEVLARLFDRLRERGVWGRTLVIVTSDHGEGLMDHGELQHGGSLFDEVLRVPLIVRFPDGRHAGRRHPGQVRSIDVLPTVLDWVGLPLPRGAVGRSLLPRIGSEKPLPAFAEALLHGEYMFDVKGLDDGRWKLVRNLRTGQELFFDLATDPLERTNLAPEAAPSERARLRAALELQVEDNVERAVEYEVTPGEFTPAERDELEALGYVGSD